LAEADDPLIALGYGLAESGDLLVTIGYSLRYGLAEVADLRIPFGYGLAEVADLQVPFGYSLAEVADLQVPFGYSLAERLSERSKLYGVPLGLISKHWSECRIGGGERGVQTVKLRLGGSIGRRPHKRFITVISLPKPGRKLSHVVDVPLLGSLRSQVRIKEILYFSNATFDRPRPVDAKAFSNAIDDSAWLSEKIEVAQEDARMTARFAFGI
jgi:hypothetical protein